MSNQGQDNGSDWIPVQDPKTGNTYYANMKTRETRWDPPPGFQGYVIPSFFFFSLLI